MAKATIPQKVNIDSLTCLYNPESIFYEVGYVVSCHFSDPEESRNFYRLKTYNINDKQKLRIAKIFIMTTFIMAIMLNYHGAMMYINRMIQL